MRVVKQAVLSLSVIVLLPLVVASVAAQPPSGFKRVSASDFKPVAIPEATAPALPRTPTVRPIVDTQSIRRSGPSERPDARLPVPAPGVSVKATPKPVVKTLAPTHAPKPVSTRAPAARKAVVKTVTSKVVVRSASNHVVGTATWYCKAGQSVCHYKYPDRRGVSDFYAAAGPRLRIGNWQGRVVNVCGRSACIRVRLVDWCQCYKGSSSERIIDLYWDAFNAVSPGAGGEKVTVTW